MESEITDSFGSKKKMKKLKILLVHHSGLLGGAGVSLHYTWKALEENYEVSCFIPSDPPELLEYLNSKGLRPKTFPFRLGKITYYSGGNSLFNVEFWYHFLRIFTQIRFWKGIIEKENPDVVFVNSKVLCWMSLLMKDVKSVCFVRETIPGNPKSMVNRLMHWLLDKFSLVAFLSQYDAEQTSLKNALIAISPDFLIDSEYEEIISKEVACEKLGLSSEKFNVLFVGGKDPIKGLNVGLLALAEIKDNNIQLVVAGYDKVTINSYGFKRLIEGYKKRKMLRYSRDLDNFIVENNMQDRVTFIGIQSDMRTVYTASDVLIFPMTKPHQARPAFEIGVQRKPVIITDFPSISEYVMNNVNGLTFFPNDHVGLAESIIKLKYDNELYKRLGEKNREFTMKFHVSEYSVMELLSGINRITE